MCYLLGLMSDSLHGRVALVTGAAIRLGRAVAMRLAKEGADMAVHYGSSQREAREAVLEIEKLGRRAIAVQADLRNVAAIRSMFQQVSAHFGRLDILVNSAANFIHSGTDATEQDWDDALNTNLKAPFFCSQAAAPLLKQTRGVIINFADVSGVRGWSGYIPHSISKAGVIMLTKCLAKALAPEVRVNAIAPGTVTLPGDAPELEADFIRRAPLRRSGTTDDVTDAVLFLARSAFITGQTLILDGGCSI